MFSISGAMATPRGLLRRRLDLAVCFCAALVVVARWYWRITDLDAQAAMQSFSPKLLAALVNHPELFVGDFPGGAPELLNGLPNRIYPLVDSLGLSVTGAWSAMIALEIVMLAVAAAFATAVFFPRTSVPEQALAAILVTSSGLLKPNLANFGFPFFGWVYGFAIAAFLFAVALTAKRQLVAASIALVFAYSCHPIIGGFTAVFMAAMVVAQFNTWRWRDFLVPFAITAVGCGLWTAVVASNATMGGGEIDGALFVALTRAQNLHWFPVHRGMFWEEHAKLLMPFLASMVLVAVAFNQSDVDEEIGKPLSFGIIAMLGLTVAGILISMFSKEPTLIKLALHRASTNALVAGAPFVAVMISYGIKSRDPILRALSAVLLLTPFHVVAGCAPVPALLRAAYAANQYRKSRSWPPSILAAAALSFLVVVLITFYSAVGLVDSAALKLYLGIGSASIGAGVVVAALLAALLPNAIAASWGRTLSVLSATALAIFVAPMSVDALGRNAINREKAYAYLAAQQWANANTPSGTLFMVDPSIPYGWRDISLRPSFGTVREWLMISILYNSRSTLLEEGIARFRALGADPLPIVLDPQATRTLVTMGKLNDIVLSSYYSMDPQLFYQLRTRFNIEYFVFEKPKITTALPLRVAFENQHYVIAKAPSK